jgi:PilZ domain/Gram-negative bacterial TonB protein C-terminal
MSTATGRLGTLEPPVERRFYPRTTPSRPIYVAFGGGNLSMLLNLSENGVLVSTPAGLDRNSVFRLSLRLHGIPKPIEVHVRTLWTNESGERAGIQFLDLSDHDREQIRKWQALEGSKESREKQSEPQPTQSASKPQREREQEQRETRIAPLPAFQPPPNPAPPAMPAFLAAVPEAEPLRNTHFDMLKPQAAAIVSRRRKRKSEAPALIAWTLVGATACLGAALLFRPDLFGNLLNRFTVASPVLVASSSTPPSSLDAQTPASTQPKATRSSTSVDKATSRRSASNESSADSSSYGATNKSHFTLASSPRPNPIAPARATQSRDETADNIADDATITDPDKTAGASTENQLSHVQPAAVASAETNLAPAPAAPSAPVVFPISQSAITRSITDTAASRPASIVAATPAPTPNSSATRSAWPGSNAPVAAGKSSLLGRKPSSDAVQMSSSTGRVAEITPPHGISASFVNLPGERVLEGSGITMHIRRSVRVPPDHWIWHSHKQVVIGDLALRTDPQTPHASPGYGTLVVEADVDKNGRITNLTPLNGSSTFLPSVTRAVREWRYEPTYLEGKRVETRAQIEIDFHPQTLASRP